MSAPAPIMQTAIRLVKMKPITPGTRHQLKLEKSVLVKNDKIFRTRIYHHYRMGRSATTGHITSWHRGGGHKKLYRDANLKNDNRLGIVVGISYDPNRTGFISTNFDLEKRKFYSALCNENVVAGSVIKQFCKDTPDSARDKLYNKTKQLMLGYRTQLQHIPIGTIINAISILPNGIAKYARAAGTRAQLIRVDDKSAAIKLPSGQLLTIPKESCASIGATSNEYQNLVVYGKAGRKRNMGRRPIVRGIAMNPVDHPHGGRTNGGRPSVTPWGQLCKCGFKLKKKVQRPYSAVKPNVKKEKKSGDDSAEEVRVQASA